VAGVCPIRYSALDQGTVPLAKVPVRDGSRVFHVKKRHGKAVPAVAGQPLLDRIPRKARQPRNLANRKLVAVVDPPDFSKYGHGNHLAKTPAQEMSRRG